MGLLHANFEGGTLSIGCGMVEDVVFRWRRRQWNQCNAPTISLATLKKPYERFYRIDIHTMSLLHANFEGGTSIIGCVMVEDAVFHWRRRQWNQCNAPLSPWLHERDLVNDYIESIYMLWAYSMPILKAVPWVLVVPWMKMLYSVGADGS